MEDEKTLLKKDLAVILKIDQRIDYGNVENIRKIHDTIVEREMFHTALGTRYINRLEQVLQEMDSSLLEFYQ